MGMELCQELAEITPMGKMLVLILHPMLLSVFAGPVQQW